MSSAALLQHLTFALGLALLSAAAVRAMIEWPILDHPNGRSAHVRPTPRGGGVGAVLAFMAGMLVLYQVANSARIAAAESRARPSAKVRCWRRAAELIARRVWRKRGPWASRGAS